MKNELRNPFFLSSNTYISEFKLQNIKQSEIKHFILFTNVIYGPGIIKGVLGTIKKGNWRGEGGKITK